MTFIGQLGLLFVAYDESILLTIFKQRQKITVMSVWYTNRCFNRQHKFMNQDKTVTWKQIFRWSQTLFGETNVAFVVIQEN